jgi:excisionase family DNA binding protein
MTISLETDSILTAGDVASLLGIPKRSVYDYAARGLIPSVRLGRHVRFLRSDVERALARLRDESP